MDLSTCRFYEEAGNTYAMLDQWGHKRCPRCDEHVELVDGVWEHTDGPTDG